MVLTPEKDALSNLAKLFTSNTAPKNASGLANVNEDFDAKILMTLTSPNCPVAESLPADVEQKVKSIKGINNVEVEMTFDPPWTKDLMSEEAKLELGFL